MVARGGGSGKGGTPVDLAGPVRDNSAVPDHDRIHICLPDQSMRGP